MKKKHYIIAKWKIHINSSPNNVFFDPVLKISEGRDDVKISILKEH